MRARQPFGRQHTNPFLSRYTLIYYSMANELTTLLSRVSNHRNHNNARSITTDSSIVTSSEFRSTSGGV